MTDDSDDCGQDEYIDGPSTYRKAKPLASYGRPLPRVRIYDPLFLRCVLDVAEPGGPLDVMAHCTARAHGFLPETLLRDASEICWLADDTDRELLRRDQLAIALWLRKDPRWRGR